MKSSSIPAPTGHYHVGFIDGSFCYAYQGAMRAIGYRCFYPSDGTGTPAMYYEDPVMLSYQTMIPSFRALKPILRRLYRMKTHAVQHAVPAQQGQGFPVIVYSHGYTSFAWSNLTQQEELASHGYVVFCLSHPGDACYTRIDEQRIPMDMEKYRASVGQDAAFHAEFGTGKPEALNESQVTTYLAGTTVLGQTVSLWVEDTKAAFDEITRMNLDKRSLLAGRMQCERFGLFGHSLGGATAFATTLKDRRVAAAVNYDGWQYGPSLQNERVGAPCLLLTCTKNHLCASYCANDPNLTCTIVRNSGHLCFCDLYAYCTLPVRLLDRKVKIQRNRMAHILNRFTLQFFDDAMHGKEISVAGVAEEFAGDVDLVQV